jgi:hypothetical protein
VSEPGLEAELRRNSGGARRGRASVGREIAADEEPGNRDRAPLVPRRFAPDDRAKVEEIKASIRPLILCLPACATG